MVDGGGLLNRCTGEIPYRGFESLPLRFLRSKKRRSLARSPNEVWRNEADSPKSKTANPSFKNMYHVYILLNAAKTRTYTGVADDVNKRLAEHNTGRVKSSFPYRPYRIIHTESFETLKEARQKEKFYKSTTGRRRLKEMFFET